VALAYGTLGVGHHGALALAVATDGGSHRSGGAHEAEEITPGEAALHRQAVDIVVDAGRSRGQKFVVGGLLGLRCFDALFKSPPELRGFERAMFGKSCLHRVIRGA
jgi:hypothetical protein